VNGLRERLRQGERMLATFSIVPSVEVVQLIALAGFDAVILDSEHGPYGVESLPPLIAGAHARGIHAIVRVRENSPAWIGAALDAGADGVLVPQVGSAREAEAAVAAARFAPLGRRGANPWVSAAGFGGDPRWFAAANEAVAVMVMIEGAEGAAAAAGIVATPHLDGVFLGPVDLSHALGVPGEIGHPSVVGKIEEVVATARARGMATGVFAATPEVARSWLDRGVGLVALGVDAGHILRGLGDARAAALPAAAGA
jgi:4-hydroxy-2-oxoheptanedioate aldolase